MSSNSPFQAAEIVRARIPADFKPRVAMILGSGLGVLAEQMTDAVTISFNELPGFPISTVHGHAGELVVGTLAGVPVVCMKGRSHFYEGKGTAVMTSAIRTFRLMGCTSVLLTCSAGSLRSEVGPGQLVALTDHINFMPGNPLVGANDERFGPRFISMANAYDGDLRALLKNAATRLEIPWHEGVYASYSGPITDDHTPLIAAGFRAINVIDIDYPSWHTPLDTPDKVSAASLEAVGNVAVGVLRSATK